MRVHDHPEFHEIDVGALSSDEWAAVIRRADIWARVERSRRFKAALRRLPRALSRALSRVGSWAAIRGWVPGLHSRCRASTGLPLAKGPRLR